MTTEKLVTQRRWQVIEGVVARNEHGQVSTLSVDRRQFVPQTNSISHCTTTVSVHNYQSRVDLIKWVSNVLPPVRTSVRPSVRLHKKFLRFNEIWYVGRGRRVMHGGMHYDPIKGQRQGHEPLKVRKSAIFKGYLPIYNGGGANK